MNQQPSVLVLAEAANPEWVSVPLVGWSMAQALRRVAKVHLVTQVRNRGAIQRAGWIEGEDFTCIDNEHVARPIAKFANVFGKNKAWTVRTALSRLPYAAFERQVWGQFGDQIRRGDFDIVHRVTPVSPALNSGLASRCKTAGTPFVLGPINGGVPWPKGFEQEQDREKEWLSKIRGLYRISPARRRMLRDTATILVGSRFAEAEIPEQFLNKTIRIPENSVDSTRFTAQAHQHGNLPVRACFIGRLVPLKGVDMLLEAAAPFLRDGTMKLDIIGDGPMRSTLEAQASALGISSKVHFYGMLPHSDVGDVAARSHTMIFPSIREFGGGVVLEAMAIGLVPIVVDYAGPAELVDNNTGFKLPIVSRDGIITALGDLLRDIVDNPAQLPPLAAAARQRVLDAFTWDRKSEQIREIYDWTLGTRREKPTII